MPADAAAAALLAMDAATRGAVLVSLPPAAAARLLQAMPATDRNSSFAALVDASAAAAVAVLPLLSHEEGTAALAALSAAQRAALDAAAGGEATPRGDGTLWTVDYTPGDHAKCRVCFAPIHEGAVRILAQSPYAAAFSNAPAKHFYHLECRAPSCAAAQLAGLGALTPKDRDVVERAMEAARGAA
jgi:hypothetical protein